MSGGPANIDLAPRGHCPKCRVTRRFTYEGPHSAYRCERCGYAISEREYHFRRPEYVVTNYDGDVTKVPVEIVPGDKVTVNYSPYGFVVGAVISALETELGKRKTKPPVKTELRWVEVKKEEDDK